MYTHGTAPKRRLHGAHGPAARRGERPAARLLKNVPTNASETKVSYVAATPKPRLVKLAIKPEAKETFFVAGATHPATRYDLKVELGGLAGIIAPIVGKAARRHSYVGTRRESSCVRTNGRPTLPGRAGMDHRVDESGLGAVTTRGQRENNSGSTARICFRFPKALRQAWTIIL